MLNYGFVVLLYRFLLSKMELKNNGVFGSETQQRDNSTSSSSMSTQVTNWSLCILCQTEKKKDPPRKVSDEVALKIEKFAKKDDSLLIRIRDTNLVTAKVLYHGLCLLDLERRCGKTGGAQKQHLAFNKLCAELRVGANKNVSALFEIGRCYVFKSLPEVACCN